MSATTEFETHINSIFLATDFTPESHTAFLHALKFAVGGKAKLSLVHVRTKDEIPDWAEFPHVRETLQQWGLLSPGSKREDLWKLGFDVQKVVTPTEDPVRACLTFLANDPADLIVLATHHANGEHHWFGKRVAEPLARKAGEITLYLPSNRPGFISPDNGSVNLNQILVPIDNSPDPQRAVDAAARIVLTLGPSKGTFTLYHCGTENAAPSVTTPKVAGWEWKSLNTSGHPADSIIKVADELSADLIVMSSEGRHGFLDAFRGSTSERVLHQAHCPLAIIPTLA